MESLRELYKIGHGPSSSHTIGPRKAAQQFAQQNHAAAAYRVTLYGSLAATGKGHFTDQAISNILTPVAPTEIVWEPATFLPFHPNGMKFEALADGKTIGEWTIYSVGGGALANEDTPLVEAEQIYQMNNLVQIQYWCDANGTSFWEYVEKCEGPDIWDYLKLVWDTMRSTIEKGLEQEGVIPGGLGVRRKAATYLVKAESHNGSIASRGKIYAYALATSEENASGGLIVTAPTCGASGVLPAILYHLKIAHDVGETRILRALATAGLVGNVVKTNGSISGAAVGCQGEVGVACAMAAAAANQLFGGTPAQIEYAAEMALEHHLGLTCDPVCGLVQVPCIERNAIAAARAFDASNFAMFSDGKHRISFDKVVEVMKETGHDIPSLYKETSEGGLAKNYTME